LPSHTQTHVSRHTGSHPIDSSYRPQPLHTRVATSTMLSAPKSFKPRLPLRSRRGSWRKIAISLIDFKM
jgi:hypothetical protein